jgi:membrane-associated phospholipid phosphatase
VTARASNALLAAAACAAGLVAVYLAAFVVGPAERADQRVFDGFLSLRSPRATEWAEFVVRFFNFAPYAVAVVIVVVAAVALAGPRKAVAVAAICLGANVTTQALKVLTAAPRDPQWLPNESWPSGHLTAATALALCVVLVAPPRLRAYAVGAGALGVLATAYSILVAGSHHPTDVVGGMLMAGAWTALGLAALELAERAWPSARPAPASRTPWRTLWVGPALAAAAGLGVLVLHASDLGDRTTFLAGAGVLAVCAAVLPAAAATLIPPELRGR